VILIKTPHELGVIKLLFSKTKINDINNTKVGHGLDFENPIQIQIFGLDFKFKSIFFIKPN